MAPSASPPQRPPPLQQQNEENECQRERQHHQERRPKLLARACLQCRTKKIRCDAVRPRCSACTTQGRECIYRLEAPRKRPTFSQIIELQRDKAALKAFILSLKQSSPEERDNLLATVVDDDGNVNHQGTQHFRPAGLDRSTSAPAKFETPFGSSEDELDIADFISVDDSGRPNSFGPSSALHNPAKSDTGLSPPRQAVSQINVRNSLVANAALQRQLEYGLIHLPSIDGTSTELALQLLNIHWTRQHHTFLLTYRPAVMRDLQTSGPNCSPFMLNAIFACTSKFSGFSEVRDNPNDPLTAGRRFFRRCDQLLAEESLLIHPKITTVIGLLLLGSTYNARGETSKGWLYTGYALRMVYDLGLHLDPKETTDSAEDVEVRRRVFWGAFVCDKLQSLYLGRPVAINLRDSQVSRDFLDLYEEKELFIPPADHGMSPGTFKVQLPLPIHSVSAFQQLCLLSKIMTTIINRFYVVGATLSNAQGSLQHVDDALQKWKENLSPQLDFQPWPSTESTQIYQPPNIMVLHGLYHSLIILLHRPFISDGHLRSTATPSRSWERCTAAARDITGIALAYKSAWTLSGAPYVLGYTIYVACTIHVRNAASQDHHGREHSSLLVASLKCLDELCLANPGVARPASIIRRLIEVNQLNLCTEESPTVDQSILSFDLDAILNMFPINNGTHTDLGMSGYRPGLDMELHPDPLFGLMDGPAVPFADLDLPTMPLE